MPRRNEVKAGYMHYVYMLQSEADPDRVLCWPDYRFEAPLRRTQFREIHSHQQIHSLEVGHLYCFLRQEEGGEIPEVSEVRIRTIFRQETLLISPPRP